MLWWDWWHQYHPQAYTRTRSRTHTHTHTHTHTRTHAHTHTHTHSQTQYPLCLPLQHPTHGYGYMRISMEACFRHWIIKQKVNCEFISHFWFFLSQLRVYISPELWDRVAIDFLVLFSDRNWLPYLSCFLLIRLFCLHHPFKTNKKLIKIKLSWIDLGVDKVFSVRLICESNYWIILFHVQ